MGEHPKADIRTALRRARKEGMVVDEIHNGHRWGTLTCPGCERSQPVYCTPKSPSTAARRIDEFSRKHAGCAEEGDSE